MNIFLIFNRDFELNLLDLNFIKITSWLSTCLPSPPPEPLLIKRKNVHKGCYSLYFYAYFFYAYFFYGYISNIKIYIKS